MKTLTKKVLIVFLFLFIINCFLLMANAAVPHMINYQGRLTDTNGTPLNGAYQLTFRIYDAETAGNLLWEEAHSGVVIYKGVFSILLGSVTSLDLSFDKAYFLEIKVGNEVLSPRQRIASAAYAIRAEHGVPKGVIVMWSGRIADVPSGWALCDGNNGTPDLRERFIVGASQDDSGLAKTVVTGSLTKAGDGQIPAHNHGLSGNHSHELVKTDETVSSEDVWPGMPYRVNFVGSRRESWYSGHISNSGAHAHDMFGSGTKVVAVYYALCFIMKL